MIADPSCARKASCRRQSWTRFRLCHGGRTAVGAVARVGAAESDAFRVAGPQRSWEAGSCSCRVVRTREVNDVEMGRCVRNKTDEKRAVLSAASSLVLLVGWEGGSCWRYVDDVEVQRDDQDQRNETVSGGAIKKRENQATEKPSRRFS